MQPMYNNRMQQPLEEGGIAYGSLHRRVALTYGGRRSAGVEVPGSTLLGGSIEASHPLPFTDKGNGRRRAVWKAR